ncbi:cellulose biosynthesis protein BcsQ [Pseudomonas sp.]|uniref:cellulose biosynthesis protein BcsQ n=1 Tax=Pseudomonas sp. TaxID=306 RepID=UPI00299D3EF3|nr:cellulose biosynthesis protein BcsQ [Pseudomonas sp.]MDX1366120.1 cellulose biosynthesis protein BcsQ [Pseudomonas sp.]
MYLIAIQGLRGGCGTTSIVAGLTSALAILHQPVLAIDLCPSNILSLHFGLPFDEPSAWATRDARSPAQSIVAFRQQERVSVLPFGRHAPQDYDPQRAVDLLEHALRQLAPSSGTFVLVNIPPYLNLLSRLDQRPDIHWLHVLEADPACHILLNYQLHDNQHLPRNHHWLINRLQPSRKLSHDLLELWRLALGQLLVPCVIHEDEAIREALARKQLLGESAPHCLAMRDFLALASWCVNTVENP